MAAALKEDYQRALAEQKQEVRELVMAGLEQIKEEKTKDFNGRMGRGKVICKNVKCFYLI